MTAVAPIAHYYLYGRLEDDAEAEVEVDFLHIEPIRKRSGANNWTIAPHAHPHHMQVLYVRKGGGTIEIEGQRIAVTVPCLMAIPVAAVHQISFEPDTDGWVITAAEAFVSHASSGDTRLVEVTRRGGVFPLAGTGLEPEQVEASFVSLQREFVYSAPGRRPTIMAYFIILLVGLMRAHAHEERPRYAGDDRVYSLLLRYRDLIEQHFRHERRLDFYADALAVTPARLNAACKARLGITASAMLQDRLITEAKRWLIYTGMSVAEIGFALGFDDPAYFSRFFSKRTGIPPGRLREEMGGKEPVAVEWPPGKDEDAG